jgi:predicted amidohydrolase YtcJ
MLAAGLTVALSSDAPVVENDSPLAGMQAAILRRDTDGERIAPDEAISIDDALDAYTRGGAIACGAEQERGTLCEGMQADMTVLSGNPLQTPPAALTALRVTQTWVGGRLVYAKD